MQSIAAIVSKKVRKPSLKKMAKEPSKSGASLGVVITDSPKSKKYDERSTRTLDGSHHHHSSKNVHAKCIRSTWSRQMVEEENIQYVIFPWYKSYKWWWAFTVFATVFTAFYETYQIAFADGGLFPYDDASSILGYILIAIFAIDIVVNFNLAYYNEYDDIIYDRRSIAKNYMKFLFWVDLVGVLPFYAIVLSISGLMGQDTVLTQYLALFRLLRLVRLYRVKQLFEILQYSSSVSFMSLTLIRNFSLALIWTHLAACIMYFIARRYDFSEENTWIGGSLSGLSGFERYCTSLYWSVVTFTTVGYGDFSPVNAVEQIWGMIFMLLNIIVQAWFIGSITLLIVKHDEKTGVYRDTLQTLAQYSELNSFDSQFHKRLKTQLKLDFSNREVADEQVLKRFPSTVRCKVLRRLYMNPLVNTQLMKGVRQQFVDSFLTTCHVEIFGPGEELLQRGSISSDLYLLVTGAVKLLPLEGTIGDSSDEGRKGSGRSSVGDQQSVNGREIGEGEFINEIGFFTESPQIETIRTMTVCKTLTMPRSAYKFIADDHPGSAGKILHNLLYKVEEMSKECEENTQGDLPKGLSRLWAGSMFFKNSALDLGDPSDEEDGYAKDVQQSMHSFQVEHSLAAVQDLVKMHINKQKDDNTTRFLFAASRGDTGTIAHMCSQGFDSNSADYDYRTALMVAAMKGNTETVSKLLEYDADPNLVDMHGTSALYEAVRNGHESTMEELLNHGGELCMNESQAASTLCQAVFDGDVLRLRRLLCAKIDVNATDYDKRTAIHIAAAEGNVAALKVLIEFGADLSVKDRWNNTIQDEAKAAKAGHLLDYLETLGKN